MRTGPPCATKTTDFPLFKLLPPFVPVICNSPEVNKAIKPDVAPIEIFVFSTFKVAALPAEKL